MNPFWSAFIVVLTAINIVGIVWLLLVTARKRKGDRPDDATTGHVWDGDIQELNKPLPRWWFGLFILTIIFALGYLSLYPGLGAFTGAFSWSSQNQLQKDVSATNSKLESLYVTFRGKSLTELAHDPAALKVGRNVFANNCAACHGSDARGAKGYPSLTDNDWLYGSEPETVQQTVLNGREGVMPPLASALGDNGVMQVSNYVRKISAQPFDALLADAGKTKFESICAACHGIEGKGNHALGAPNLTDDIWLYGGSLATIRETITYGRNGRMPGWGPLIGEDRAKLAAAWVLAQGQTKP